MPLTLGIFTLTNVFASTTGSHFNPAITFGFMLKKRAQVSSRWLGLGYIIFQFAGGILGALTAMGISNYSGKI